MVDFVQGSHGLGGAERLLGRERVGGGSAWRLLLFSFFVFSVILVGYLGLRFGYTPFLNGQIKGTDQKINDLARLTSEAERENLTKFYYQAVNLKTVLDAHVISSKMFPVLERITHERVRYSSVSWSVDTSQVNLAATAATPEVFVQQIEGYRKFKEITSYAVSSVTPGEGGVINFGATLTLAPETFR